MDEDELRGRLLAINSLDAPVRVVERRRKLVVGWRHDEVQWCELLSRRGLSGLYELHLHIDPRTRTVTFKDRQRSVQFLFCPEGENPSRVVLPFLRLRANWLGSVEQYATMEPFQYDFLPREIKAPVLGTLPQRLNVRFSPSGGDFSFLQHEISRRAPGGSGGWLRPAGQTPRPQPGQSRYVQLQLQADRKTVGEQQVGQPGRIEQRPHRRKEHRGVPLQLVTQHQLPGPKEVSLGAEHELDLVGKAAAQPSRPQAVQVGWQVVAPPCPSPDT